MTDPAVPSPARARFAWCLFDFANSGFNTVVVTFVYAQFFARRLVGDAQRGEALWGFVMAGAGLCVALLSPFLGVAADRSAHKLRYTMVASAITVAATAALFWPSVDPVLGTATTAALVAAVVLVAIAVVAFEVMFVFYNALLPSLVAGSALGRLSGYGWGAGYAGGLLCLALCLGCVAGFGSGPWLPTEGDVHLRATNLVVAAWFAVFGLPLFLWVREPAPQPATGERPASVLRATWVAVRSLSAQPDLLRFLVARLFYNDALIALIQLSGLYMASNLGMAPAEILVWGIGLNVVAGLGSVFFGHVDDARGAKFAVAVSLGLLIAGCLLAVLSTRREVFAVAAILVGLGTGPNQAASRTLLARMIDPRRAAEAYGLYALSGKATVWLGPLCFAIVRTVSEEPRWAFVPLLLLFGVGAWLLVGVDEHRAQANVRSQAPMHH